MRLKSPQDDLSEGTIDRTQRRHRHLRLFRHLSKPDGLFGRRLPLSLL